MFLLKNHSTNFHIGFLTCIFSHYELNVQYLYTNSS